MVPFGNFGWNFGFGFGWLITAISFFLIVFAIVRLVRMAPGGEQRSAPGESALDELKKRYARGEISKEEFEAKKKDIQ
jgi:putative membrane protein